MKHVIAAVVLALFTTGLALAADPIILPARLGNVSFPHKKHKELVMNCKACHAKGPGKIDELDKDWAHKVCKGCHEEKKAGPTKCSECHKR